MSTYLANRKTKIMEDENQRAQKEKEMKTQGREEDERRGGLAERRDENEGFSYFLSSSFLFIFIDHRCILMLKQIILGIDRYQYIKLDQVPRNCRRKSTRNKGKNL